MLQIYQDAFNSYNLGLASAGAIILGLLLLGSSIVNIRVMGKGHIQD
jgi:ABC-type sugar transport system permease subunit